MRIGVVLSYFDYFLNFPQYDKENEYIFISANKRFKSTLGSSLNYFDFNTYKDKIILDTSENFEYYFAFGIRSKMIKYPIELPRLSRIYEIYFEQLFRKNKVDFLLTGGITGFERCALKIAKDLGIKTFVIWEGQFRPNTISYDKEGMNAESSIAQMSLNEILRTRNSEDSSIDYMRNVDLFKKSGKNNISKISRKIYDKSFIERFAYRIVERKYFEKAKVPILSLLMSRLNYYTHKNKYATLLDINKPFFFFPLQVHTDSNYLINSNFDSISESIEIVKQSFLISKTATNFNLCIKEHPLDVFRTRYLIRNEDNLFWLYPFLPTNEILNHPLCKGTITINSTTGFESLMLEKPVLALGKSIYAKDGLCNFNYSSDSLEIANEIDRLEFTKVEKGNVSHFGCYLLDNHQWKGNLSYSPTLEEIQSIIKILCATNE